MHCSLLSKVHAAPKTSQTSWSWGTFKKSSPPCWRQFWRERKRLKNRGGERKRHGLVLEKGPLACSLIAPWIWLVLKCLHISIMTSAWPVWAQYCREGPKGEGTWGNSVHLQQVSRALLGPFAMQGELLRACWKLMSCGSGKNKEGQILGRGKSPEPHGKLGT